MTDTPSARSSQDALDAEALARFARLDHGAGGPVPAELQAWLAASPAHRAAFARWQRDWARLDGLPESAVDRLRRQLAKDQAAAAAAAPARPGRRRWLARLSSLVPPAGLAAGLLSATGGGYLAWDRWQRQPVFRQDFASARGQQLDLALPDGSRLRLDTATRIAVTLYRQRREVRLTEGQVLFQVQGDAARPFDVLAGAVKVTVVGTRFSVRHTAGVPGAGGVRVAVDRGRVRVSGGAESAAPAVELGAGQQLGADAAGRLSPVSAVPPAGIAPWRDGRIFFDDVPLAQALAEFERYGATGLRVRDPAVAAMRVTGTFDPLRPAHFRQALPRVLPVRLHGAGPSVEIQAIQAAR
jgi:transmembrane sensor